MIIKQKLNQILNLLLCCTPVFAFVAIASAQTKPTVTETKKSKYFVVQNIATERMRVYERCTLAPDCPHQLIMESDMVVGRTSSKGLKGQPFLTRVGYYTLTKWVKFYEDNASHYPSWYDPKYPRVPKDADASDWMGKDLLPNPKQNIYRGAFGWYAGMVAPNADFQWIHGTYGWGKDGDKYIQLTRNLFLNLVSDPRSAGCTRLENQAVAWLRHHIEPGTEIFRVYAMEAFADPKLSRYANQMKPTEWEWMLTGTGVRLQNAASSDKNVVKKLMERGLVKENDILETGVYSVDQYPNGLGFTPTLFGLGSSQGTTGDTYSIGKKGFKGVFLVDEGRFVNYVHPKDVPKGGTGAQLPAYAVAKVDYVLAEPYKNPLNDDRDKNPWGGIASTSTIEMTDMTAMGTGDSFSDFARGVNTLNDSTIRNKNLLNKTIGQDSGLKLKNIQNFNFEVPENLKTHMNEFEYNELLNTLSERNADRLKLISE